jgi:hypothetical protein
MSERLEKVETSRSGEPARPLSEAGSLAWLRVLVTESTQENTAYK